VGIVAGAVDLMCNCFQQAARQGIALRVEKFYGRDGIVSFCLHITIVDLSKHIVCRFGFRVF
jgi:hypothetical protein